MNTLSKDYIAVVEKGMLFRYFAMQLSLICEVKRYGRLCGVALYVGKMLRGVWYWIGCWVATSFAGMMYLRYIDCFVFRVHLGETRFTLV